MKINKILLLMNLFFLCSCAQQTKDIVTFKENKTVEYKSDFDSCSLIAAINYKAIDNSMISNNSIYLDGQRMTCSKVDTSVLGQQKIVFNLNKKLYQLDVEVKDTIAPSVEVENIETKIDEEVDLLSKIKVDDLDDNIKIEIQGDYDFSKSGTYDLKAIASDSSGNVTEKEFTLTVLEDEEEKETSNKKVNSNSTNKSQNSYVAPTPTPYVEPTPTPYVEPEPVTTSDNSSNNYQATNSCNATTIHVEGETADQFTSQARSLMDSNGCSDVSVESDGTQYGWNIVCSCN